MSAKPVAPAAPADVESGDGVGDMEDLAGGGARNAGQTVARPVASTKRKRAASESNELDKNWREILGPPPAAGQTAHEREQWIRYHKKKWAIQLKQRQARKALQSRADDGASGGDGGGVAPVPMAPVGAGVLRTNLGGFLRRAQQTLLSSMWQILQVRWPTGDTWIRFSFAEMSFLEISTRCSFGGSVQRCLNGVYSIPKGRREIDRALRRACPVSVCVLIWFFFLRDQVMETSQPGLFRLWALVGTELHQIRLTVPRIFYLNKKKPLEPRADGAASVWRKVNRVLPRSHRVYHLYEYSVPEEVYQQNFNQLMADLSTSDNAGIYETQVRPFSFLFFLVCY